MTNIKNSAIQLGILGFFLAFGFSACKTVSKTTSQPIQATKTFTTEEYLANQIDFKSFTGKTDLNIINKDGNQKVNANIKMRKGKDIWSSVLVLGGMVEVARAYITPDSLQAIVRIGKKSYNLSYEEGLKLIQAQVEFPVLQNLIIGNPLMDDGKISDSRIKDSLMVITMGKDDFTQVLSYQVSTHLLQKTELSSAKKNFKCTILYSNYKPLALKEPFAFTRNLEIDNNGTIIKIDMNFEKAEINTPVEINFSIPNNYTPASIGGN